MSLCCACQTEITYDNISIGGSRIKEPHRHHHLSDGLPSDDFQSLDYDISLNKPYRTLLIQQTDAFRVFNNFFKWVLIFVIGSATALIAVFIDVMLDQYLMHYKFKVVEKSIHSNKKTGTLAYSLLFMMLFNGGYVLIASILTAFEPLASGSGIPEVKCYLNGVKIPNVVRGKTVMIKAIGVLFSVGGGLFVGREGPMIHSGAIMGAAIPQFQINALTPHCKRCMLPYPYYRNDREKRDFVSAGAAAGVAAAFGAPIGGVLFSLEEGSSFWNQNVTWKSLACAMMSTGTLNFFLSGFQYDNWHTFDNPGLLNFGTFACTTNTTTSGNSTQSDGSDDCYLWSVYDLFAFILIGCGGGLLGALFNSLNYHLTRHRMLNTFKRGKFARVIEAVLVGLVTTFVTFTAAMVLGNCTKILTDDPKNLRDFFCPEGDFNDMATLFYNTQETAIKALFHQTEKFSLRTLIIFNVCFFFLCCWTYGILVPSGLFVPCILCGAAYGRIVGHLIQKVLRSAHFNQSTLAGSYSLIGSAAFLGGVVRMTISLCSILLETTNDISYGLPIMVTLLAAKFVGDLFNIGLYDIHIEMKGIPLLEWDAPDAMEILEASDIMTNKLRYVYPHTRIRDLLSILRTTTHNAFPVVTPNQESYNDHIVHENYNNLKADGVAFNRKAINDEEGLFAKKKEDTSLVDYMLSLKAAGKYVKGLRFHGMILRSQIMTLLKHHISYHPTETHEMQPKLNYWQLIADYPRYPNFFEIEREIDDIERVVDLTDYMNPCPFTIFKNAPVTQVFNIFRTMGLRHLPVLNTVGEVTGIITRHDLTHEYLNDIKTEKLKNQ